MGHSAGGFYMLYTATLNRVLPIEKLIFYAAPLNGTKLADLAFEEDENREARMEFYSRYLFDLRGVLDLKTSRTQAFLRDYIRIDSQIGVDYGFRSSTNCRNGRRRKG